LKRADEFDVVHFHIAQLHFPVARRYLPCHVTTLHGRLDLPELVPLYDEFADIPCVSISDAQRRPLLQANWVETIYHGLPPDLLRFQPETGSYLAFLGRISPEKRLDRAIAIARACRQPLKVAAKVDPADAEYFQRDIRPLLDGGGVEFIGEIAEKDKKDFLGHARALLFPIDWPEPFGLVMIEALACGTPVIAFRGGSVAEVLEHGVSGFIVDSEDEAVEAVHRIDTLDRRMCRAIFDQRFSVARMAAQYVSVYERIMAQDHFDSPVGEPPCSASYA
jgi:glycosyltransferase involved in cell wall biosynthesis